MELRILDLESKNNKLKQDNIELVQQIKNIYVKGCDAAQSENSYVKGCDAAQSTKACALDNKQYFSKSYIKMNDLKEPKHGKSKAISIGPSKRKEGFELEGERCLYGPQSRCLQKE